MAGEPVKSEQSEVHLGAQGRLVILAALRRSLGFNPGDVLIARRDENRLILEKADAVKLRLKQRFSGIPAEESLVDELIAERRDAARTGERS